MKGVIVVMGTIDCICHTSIIDQDAFWLSLMLIHLLRLAFSSHCIEMLTLLQYLNDILYSLTLSACAVG